MSLIIYLPQYKKVFFSLKLRFLVTLAYQIHWTNIMAIMILVMPAPKKLIITEVNTKLGNEYNTSHNLIIKESNFPPINPDNIPIKIPKEADTPQAIN